MFFTATLVDSEHEQSCPPLTMQYTLSHKERLDCIKGGIKLLACRLLLPEADLAS